MLAELMAGSLDSSPALQHIDRQTLIREAMTATTKQLDRNSRYADPDEARDNRFQRDGGGGVGITVERTDDKKIMIRAVQDGSPAAKAGIQVGDQILSIDGELMIDRPLSDVVGKLRGSVGAPVAITVLRASQGGEYVISMKRGRIIPTTVMYERRGDVALIHLTGFNSATTDNPQGRHRQGRPSSARTWPASSSTCAPTAAACSTRRRPCRSCSSTTAPSSPPAAAIPTAGAPTRAATAARRPTCRSSC